ncbi:hypothetical protein [Microbacterium timonense]|uniref:hypothetical protein n=1 Tax=Microbacterium timonense TaxID=2086576 RepID=UPI000D0F699C|nr:hypothetical protein [Microbacterium timonense]
MAYSERNIWAQLIASIVGTAVYLSIVLPQLDRPVDDIDWAWPMAWTIIGAIVASIVISIVWGILAGMRDPDEEHSADQRDREIGWFGDRIGQAFSVIGGVAALILAMVEAHWFWIGNVLFLGFFLSASLSAIARLIAYRRGFQ